MDKFGEDADYFVWAKRASTTWDQNLLLDQAPDADPGPYMPLECVSPQFTGDNMPELCLAVAQWYVKHHKDIEGELFLWTHQGRGWMLLGTVEAHNEMIRDSLLIFKNIKEGLNW